MSKFGELRKYVKEKRVAKYHKIKEHIKEKRALRYQNKKEKLILRNTLEDIGESSKEFFRKTAGIYIVGIGIIAAVFIYGREKNPNKYTHYPVYAYPNNNPDILKVDSAKHIKSVEDTVK